LKFLAERIAKNGPELHALLSGGLPYFVTARSPAPLSDAVPVFCYHVVFGQVFEKDLQFLQQNNYNTLTADEVLNWTSHSLTIPQQSIALTFDDGADNFYHVAYPLLRKYNQKAILFLSPGLHRCQQEEPLACDRPCTWEELDEMHASGLVDIQSHTWEHRSLQSWPTPLPLTGMDNDTLQARREAPLSIKEDLTKSRQALECRFSKPVRHLAWPCYYSATDTIHLAEQVGYKALWTGTLPHIPMITRDHDPHAFVRISGEFVQRLPGSNRKSLFKILSSRYKQALFKLSQGSHS